MVGVGVEMPEEGALLVKASMATGSRASSVPAEAMEGLVQGIFVKAGKNWGRVGPSDAKQHYYEGRLIVQCCWLVRGRKEKSLPRREREKRGENGGKKSNCVFFSC